MNEVEDQIAQKVRELEWKEAEYVTHRNGVMSEIENLRRSLRRCSHSIAYLFPWSDDDGYGHWRKGEGLRCQICGKQNRYPGSGSWY